VHSGYRYYQARLAKDSTDPELAQQLELEALPALSTANVREMMRAVMPLPQTVS